MEHALNSAADGMTIDQQFEGWNMAERVGFEIRSFRRIKYLQRAASELMQRKSMIIQEAGFGQVSRGFQREGGNHAYPLRGKDALKCTCAPLSIALR